MKNLIVWLNNIINKHKALKRWRRVVTVLAAIITFVTTYALILPAITVEKNKVEDVGGMYLEQEADTNDMLEENALEPIGVSIAAEHENAVTFAYADDSMTATAVFGTNDEIPAGAELVVTPIDPESVEYTSLSSRAAELLDKEFIYDVTTCSFYDFALVLNNVDVTPKTGLVDIQIIFHDNTVEHLDDTFFAGRFARSADDSSDVKDELVSVNPDESSVIELADGIITVLSLKGNDLSETDSLVGILAGNVDEEIKAAAAETDAEIPDSEDAQEESAQADSAGTDGEEAAPKVGTLKASGSDYTVTLTYDATSEIPEGASLTVSEIAQNSKEYKKYLEETKKAMGLTEEETLPQYAARFFDIKIMVGGDEFVPESGVTVEIAYTEPLAANPETEVNAVHFHNDTTEPEVIEANVTEISSDGTSNVEFTAEAFSVYGVVYTVDFHWEVDGKMYEYSLSGGDSIGFRKLVEVLGIVDGTNGEENSSNNSDSQDKIDEFVNDIENIQFSAPELVWVGKITEDLSAGQIAEQNGLAIEYSGELTDEQKAEMAAKAYESGEWVLLSEKPFDTEELLTVAVNTGEEFTIKVTDARDPLGLDSRTFAMVYHTDDETLSVQSALAWSDIGGRVVTYNETSGTEYCDPEATAWKFSFDHMDEDTGACYYYISAAGYHSDSDEELYLNIGSAPLLVSKADAVPMQVERDEDGNYQFSDGNGHYLARNNTEYASLQTFMVSSTDASDSYAQFRLCLPEESNDNSSHKATLISAADTQPGQKIIIYQRVLLSDDTFKYFAIDGNGELVEVSNSSDSIYWKGNESIEWTLTELGSGYYTLYNEATGMYLTPKSDDIVHTAWDLDFEGESKHLSISLPGRESGAYTSQIASWDYNANVTYGMKVSGSATDPDINSQGLLSSQYFYFAARDPIVHDQLTTVATVDSASKGITIKMYDWGNATGTDSEHNSVWWDRYTDGDDYGTSGKIQTRLAWMQGIMGTGSDNYNERSLEQGLASRTLDTTTGFPDATNAGSGGTIHNLSELFADDYLTSSNANHLFLQSVYDETGFFKYSSFENYAYLGSGDNFTVYEQIGTPSTRGTTDPANGNYTSIDNPADYLKVFMRGNFMPYNELNAAMSYRFNEYDPDMNALSEDDPRRNERLYFIENANPDWSPNPEASADYYFGMTVEAKFTQNPGGISDNGDPMVFEFNGDDDMWVYIDNVLVLDVGGVHDAFRGRINFRTGEVTVYIAGHGTVTGGDNNTTIKGMFKKAGKFPDGTDWDDSKVDDYFTGNTFKDYSTHDFKMIYMERGASASNLEMMFNLPVLTSSQFRVKKEMPETATGAVIQSKYADAAFYYEAYVKVNNEFVKVTRDFLNTWLASTIENADDRLPVYEDGTPVVWKSDSSTETIFEIKPGDTACFPAVDDSVEWYVVEVEPEDVSNMLDDFAVTNSDPDTTVNGDPTGTHTYSDEFTRYLKSNVKTIGNRNIVTYTNKPDDNLVNELQIKKRILGTPYNEDDAFEYRIFLETTDGEMVAYSLGEYYQIDSQGRYVYYENGVRKLQSENPGGPYTYTQDGETVTSSTPRYAEHTSTNGSLGDIRDGDTIIVKGLLEGTDFYVYERTNYDYMSKDGTLIPGKYVFEGTEVTDAAIRATHENWPEHPVGGLFDEPTGLDDLLDYYNASAYERSKAASGTIIQGEGKDAKVLVKNRPCGEISVEKEWLDEDGEKLEEHPDSITYTIYQLKHEHEWAVYSSGVWDDSQKADGDGWYTISDDGHTKTEMRRCRFASCDHHTETRTSIEPCEEHQWSEWTRTTEPACTSTGLETRTCSVCGAVETRTVAKLGHNWDIVDGEEHWVVTTEPSCTEAGVESIECLRCGKTINRPYGQALGHDYVDTVVTDPTCTEEGLKNKVCSRCGDTVTGETIPALGHNMGEWYNWTATCTAAGLERRDCSRCDYYETRTADALGHDYVWVSNGDGTETGTCSRCGDQTTRTQQNLVPGTTIVTDDDAWPDDSHGDNDPITLTAGSVFKYVDESGTTNYYLIYNNATQNYSNLKNGPDPVLGWGFVLKLDTSTIYNSTTYNPNNNQLTAGTIYQADDGTYYIWKNAYYGGPSANPATDGNWYHLTSGTRSLNSVLSRSMLKSSLSGSGVTDIAFENSVLRSAANESDDSDAEANNDDNTDNADDSSDDTNTDEQDASDAATTRGSVSTSNLTLTQLLTDLDLTAVGVKNENTGNTLTVYKSDQTLATTSATLVDGETNLWHADITIPLPEDDSTEYRYYVVETDPAVGGEYTTTYTGQEEGLVPSGTGNHNVKITNKKKPVAGSIRLTKTYVVTDPVGDPDKAFTFTITFSGDKLSDLGTSYKAVKTGSEDEFDVAIVASGDVKTATVTLKAGETIEIKDLPIGITYTITEKDDSGYKVTGTTNASNQTVTKDGIETTFTNERVFGKLTVTKTVQLNGDNTDELGTEFWVAVYSDAEATTKVAGPKKITTTNGTGSVEFDKLDPGTYYVYELTAEDGAPITGTSGEISGVTYTVTTDNSDAVITKADLEGTASVANNKTEKGTIVVNKSVLYNGAADTEVSGKTIIVGLYKDAAAQQPVKQTVDEQEVNWTETITLGESGTGNATFRELDYGQYYVFELDASGQPVVGTNGVINGVAYTVTYTDNGPTLSHSAQSATVVIENSQTEKGSLKVTKQVQLNGTNTAVTEEETFKIGLYKVTSEENEGTVTETETFVESKEIQVTTGGSSGEQTFNNLVIGAKYRVYELDGDDKKITSNGVLGEYVVTYDANQTIEITRASKDGTTTVTNNKISLVLDILKVQNDTETPLEKATFKLWKIDGTSASLNKYSATEQEAITDAQGKAQFNNLTIGYYIVTETNPPDGYVITGEDSFYIEVTDSGISLLIKSDGAPNTWTKNATSYGNVKTFTAATATANAQATVENEPGAALPNTGGPGTKLFTILGSILLLGAGVLLLKRRKLI